MLQPYFGSSNLQDTNGEPQNKTFSRQLIKKTKYMEPELTSAEVPNLFFPGDTNPREDKMGCRIQKPKETNAKIEKGKGKGYLQGPAGVKGDKFSARK